MHRARRQNGIAALLAVVLVVLVSFYDMGGWDPARFLRVGEVSASKSFVTQDIPDVRLAPGWGHDGQANYVLAAVFPDLTEAEGHVDSVTYRARRIVFPALVSVLPRGLPMATGMWALNLAAVAGTAVIVAELARRHGAHWGAGVVVGVTPAFIASTVIGLGDGLALFFAGAGVWAWRRDRGTTLAVVLFTLGALTRETTLVIPAAVFLFEGRGRRSLLLVAPAATLLWIAVLEAWIGDPGKSAAQFRPPFMGFFDARTAATDVAVACAYLLGSVWVADRLWRIDRVWAAVVALEALVLVCVDRAVLFNPLNLSRVTPWVLPLAAIVVTAGRGASADEDGLGGETDPVVESLVDRAPAGNIG